MDYYGFLGLIRRLDASFLKVNAVRKSAHPEWSWVATPIFYPESICPFCDTAIRSPGIWFLKGPKHERLIGAFFPGPTITLIQPSHPHDVGSGHLCLGCNLNGIALLASKPNLNDTPMGTRFIPQWLKLYWNHRCKPARTYLLDRGYMNLLRELDKL